MPATEGRVQEIVPSHPDLVPDVEVPDAEFGGLVVVVVDPLQGQAGVRIPAGHEPGHAAAGNSEAPEDYKK